MQNLEDIRPLRPPDAAAWLRDNMGMDWITERTLRTERDNGKLA